MTPRRAAEVSELPTLREVIPQLPPSAEELEMLREDLRRMECAGLLMAPWGFQEEVMVKELLGEVPTPYLKTVRAQPDKWTRKMWREVYGFRKDGYGLTAGRTTSRGSCSMEGWMPRRVSA